MVIYCTTLHIQHTRVTMVEGMKLPSWDHRMGVSKKMGRWDHKTLSMIAPFPLFIGTPASIIAKDPGQKWGYSISQLSNVVHTTQLSFNYWTYWSIFQLSLEYINKQLEVIQIAVFVTSDTLRGMYKMEHLPNPVCFLSRASQDMHRRVRDFHQ